MNENLTSLPTAQLEAELLRRAIWRNSLLILQVEASLADLKFKQANRFREHTQTLQRLAAKEERSMNQEVV